MFKQSLKNLFTNILSEKCTESEISTLTEQVVLEHDRNKEIVVLSRDGTPTWVNIQEIYYVEKPKKEAILHTKKGVYYHKCKEYDILELIEKINGFALCDTRTYVNKDLVKKYDSYMEVIYFDDVIDESTVRLRILQNRIKIFKDKLGNENDINIKDSVFLPNTKPKRIFGRI